LGGALAPVTLASLYPAPIELSAPYPRRVDDSGEKAAGSGPAEVIDLVQHE
jgi:hypothetical protein